jgi:mRNA interferase MazF
MNPGDIVLLALPVLGSGATKLRPALILAPLPGPYQTLLLCGISTQPGPLISNWNEQLAASDLDFPQSGFISPPLYA